MNVRPMLDKLLVAALLLVAGCGSPEDPAAPVVRRYATNLFANYKDVADRTRALQAAVDTFVAAPSAAGLAATRQAWLDIRPAYGESEVSRFYGGPIDDVQGRVDEWPIDENFIDYTFGNPSGGIINDPVNYPQLTPQVLAVSDQRGGVENLSTGFHAIEFLLWGQRVDQTVGPGERPYTDYVDGGTATNQERRRTYLKAATDLLLADLESVAAEWDVSAPSSYGAMLVASPSQTGLTKILRGFGNMAISELLYERMNNPYVTQDRKDEQSCFSESTSIDLTSNALGVENAYLGRYHDLSGPSISDLVKAKDPALDARLRQKLADARAAVEAIPAPFDHAVLSPPTSDANLRVKAAIDAFGLLREDIVAVAATLGVTLNL